MLYARLKTLYYSARLNYHSGVQEEFHWEGLVGLDAIRALNAELRARLESDPLLFVNFNR